MPIRIDSTGESTIKAVVIHDDEASVTQAQAILDRLTVRSSQKLQFVVRPWGFGAMASPQSVMIALGDALRADLVILAVHADAELPEVVTDWLQRWAVERAVHDAAVALVQPEPAGADAEPARADDGLRKFCAANGIYYLGTWARDRNAPEPGVPREAIPPGSVETLTPARPELND